MRPMGVLMSAVPIACCVAATAGAQVPDNGEVESQVDGITQGHEYDWLRPPKSTVGRQLPAPSSPQRSEDIRQGRGRGCDFEPQPGSPSPEPLPARQARETRPFGDCGAAPASGEGGGGSQPLGSDSGCGCTPGSCSSELPGFPGCGCGGIGAFANTTGYLIAAIFFVLIVFMVARAIIRKDKPEARLSEPDAGVPPDRIRLSEVLSFTSDQMMGKARAAAEAGDYKQAVGWAYLCGIGMLHRAGYTDLGIATTNHQIIANTRRGNGPYEQTAQLIRIFEDLFFGAREPLRQKWEACRHIVEVDFELVAQNPS